MKGLHRELIKNIGKMSEGGTKPVKESESVHASGERILLLYSWLQSGFKIIFFLFYKNVVQNCCLNLVCLLL